MPDVSPPTGARTLVRNGLMQTDLDADNHQILNLDTSNLVLDPIPAQSAPPHQWYNSYDPGPHHLGSTQPQFLDISGNLSSAQQLAITKLGTITVGTWNGSVIAGTFLTTLDLIRAPAANVNFNNKRIINLADGIDPQDAATLRQVTELTGRNPKAACRCATTADILPLSGLLTVDGVTLVDGDRILVKDQITIRVFGNGIYNAHAGVWTRSTDADTGTELVAASTFILEGTVNAGTTWYQTTPAPIILGTTEIDWVLISTSSDISAGPGLQKIGNVISAVGTTNRISISTGIDISASYVGQASITTLGTITTGTWNGTVIDPSHGGTGVVNAYTLTLAGPLLTTLGFAAPAGSPLTFVLSNSTTLTLPVTGTVATLGGVETFTNKHISASQIDSGAIAIAHGGTGQTTAANAINALLPIQNPGDAGKKLTTDGLGNLSWT